MYNDRINKYNKNIICVWYGKWGKYKNNKNGLIYLQPPNNKNGLIYSQSYVEIDKLMELWDKLKVNLKKYVKVILNY